VTAKRGSRKTSVDAPAQTQSAVAESMPLLIARVPLTIRWRDLDAFNHVNNSNFLTYVEEARLNWLSGIEGHWFGEDMMPLIAATHMNYRRQLAWPGRIVVELYATRIGNTSLTLGHRIVAPEDANTLYADGDAVIVWIDPRDGRPVALPAAILAAVKISA